MVSGTDGKLQGRCDKRFPKGVIYVLLHAEVLCCNCMACRSFIIRNRHNNTSGCVIYVSTASSDKHPDLNL